jgi:hypothetical protein
MAAQQFVTREIREQAGQYARVTERYMVAAGVERMGNCSFCGHAIRNHVGVQAPDGSLAWAGSNCAGILCNAAPAVDLAAGERYTDNGREYVAIDKDFCERLGRAAYRDWDKLAIGQCPVLFTRNGQFLSSLLKAARQYGQLTVKQYEAAIRAM